MPTEKGETYLMTTVKYVTGLAPGDRIRVRAAIETVENVFVDDRSVTVLTDHTVYTWDKMVGVEVVPGEAHIITLMPHGADCSCGRTFSIWANNNQNRARYAARFRNLARANARRHAEAANKREE